MVDTLLPQDKPKDVEAYMSERHYPLWKQLLLFALVGPPIGSLSLFLASLPAEQYPLAKIPLNALGWLVVSLPLAYILGLIPAMVTGIAFSLIRARASSPDWASIGIRFFGTAVVGACTSVGFWLLVSDDSGTSLMMAVDGAVAAMVCTTLVEWCSRHPDNSPKRTREKPRTA